MTPFDARLNESLTTVGAVDFSSLGTVKLMLLTDAVAPDPAANSVLADVSANEVATGIAYAAGGPTLTGVTYSKVATYYELSASDLTIDQDAGSGFINARYAVAYQVSSGKLLAFQDFGSNRRNDDKSLVLNFTTDVLLRWGRAP